MDLSILEILKGEDGLPQFDKALVKFRSGDHALVEGMPRMSTHENCKLLVFIELTPGFFSETRSTDIDQMVVCLSGKLRISTDDGDTQDLVPGNVARLKKADCSTYTMSVASDAPAHLMVVQLEG
ncbi:cupin domain-containing protein [Parasedimentitalea psychrophila]|uniref:Cupin n=1 Tax=Parasedimentitalea psychrophila TaxID=2997337 RepID=A0A9Y2L693_9RHOB|nr:hypothetical protein [Parasedimentitalea psychrophila]WIY27694.1 hypothetical protein QPJ95_12410 [Parasedimentitalea psychrophila]